MSRLDNRGKGLIILTEEQKIKIEALAAVLNIDQIADYMEISRSGFYEIMKRDPEVVECLKRGRVKTVAMAAGNLLKKVRDGDLRAIMFYLKTKGGYSENININNEMNPSLEPTQESPGNIIPMTYDEKKEMVRKYQEIIERQQEVVDVSPIDREDKSSV